MFMNSLRKLIDLILLHFVPYPINMLVIRAEVFTFVISNKI